MHLFRFRLSHRKNKNPAGHGVPEDCRTRIFARLCVVALTEVKPSKVCERAKVPCENTDGACIRLQITSTIQIESSLLLRHEVGCLHLFLSSHRKSKAPTGHGVPEDVRKRIFARLCVVALAEVRLQITITYSDSKLLLLGREEDDCISSGRRAGKARIRLATACRRIPGSKTIQQHIHTALCCRAHPRMQHRDS